MNYPLISEYVESIRYAEDNFDKLKNLRPILDDNGNPVMSSGNFSVVFKMKDKVTEKFFAVKCFTREQIGRTKRYKAIVKELENFYSRYFVNIQFYEKELFVNTSQSKETLFPVLVLDWVEGNTLDVYMKSIKEDQVKRKKLATDFQNFICWLLPRHFAHGDLKPENILIENNGNIVLIDYDGMFVPSLRGETALENGTPMFCYAGRTLSFFNEYIDDYPAVVLLLILKLNAISDVNMDDILTTNPADFFRYFETFLNHPIIAPLLSAFILVSTYGKIDRQQVNCLLSDNSEFDYNKELKLLDEARAGNTVAMLQLGSLYQNGIYAPQNKAMAIQWFELAYLLGNPKGACELCKSYFCGDEFCSKINMLIDKLAKNKVPFAYCRKGEDVMFRDIDQAKYVFSLGIKENFPQAKYWLGNIFDREGEVNKALEFYMQAANEGSLFAQQKMAELYKEGKIVEKDSLEAIEWYKKAGEQGDSKSLYNIGLMFYDGDGVEKNHKKSFDFFQESAILDNTEAQFMLGICYINGAGVSRNITTAISWFQKAARKKHEKSLIALGGCYENGYGVEKDIKMAINCYSIAAKEGNSDAEYKLEQCCKKWNLKDEINTSLDEIGNIGECNTATYSKDNIRLLCYWGTYGEEYHVKEGTEILCDDSFNDLYSECDGHYLEALYLPSSLRRIGNNVFCASITDIVCDSYYFYTENGFLLSTDNKTLYRYFGNGKTVIIPQGVKYIKGGAFSEKGIEKVVIPDTIKYIGDNPFAGCKNIKEIISNSKRFQIIDKSLYDVEEKRLISCWNNMASHIHIENDTLNIGKNSLFGLGFKSIDLPISIKKIDESAFYHCLNLSNILIPSILYGKIYDIIPKYLRSIDGVKISIENIDKERV